MSSDRQQTSDDWDAMVKASHTLTREQVITLESSGQEAVGVALPLCQTIATLQATLAEREARIKELEESVERATLLKAAISDEAGWEAAKRFEGLYDTARQDAARLRKALEAVLPIVKEVAAIEQAQRALKGVEPTVEEKVRQACERGEVWDGVRWLTKDEASNLKGGA